MTIITLGFISLINLFFVPIIGLKIYCKRHEMKWTIAAETGYLYILFTVLNFLLTHVFLEIVEITLHMVIHLEMSKYTIVALVSCALLAFIMEGIEKYLHVNVSVAIRKTKQNDKQENLDEK